jgi:hypothetical protein
MQQLVTGLLLVVYIQLNMFRASSCPSSGAYQLQQQPLVCQSLHRHTVQINQLTRCKNFSSLLLDVCLQLNMFRTSSRPSSGAQQLQ